MAGRRPGRPPGPTSTSADVLAAARTLFAERGYRATTVRAIAAAAGVTPAMVHHFFGSKQKVFLAAIRMPIDPLEIIDGLVGGSRSGLAERFVRTFVALWSSEPTASALATMLRTALADEEQAAAVRTFAGTVLLPRAAAALDVPAERMAAAFTTMLGVALGRHLIGIEPLAHMSEDEVVACYVPVVRAALRG